jgi:hypothetical protein
LARFEQFQRLLLMSEPAALSLNAQAAMGAVRAPKRSQFWSGFSIMKPLRQTETPRPAWS